jgi:hypothetical protein
LIKNQVFIKFKYKKILKWGQTPKKTPKKDPQKRSPKKALFWERWSPDRHGKRINNLATDYTDCPDYCSGWAPIVKQPEIKLSFAGFQFLNRKFSKSTDFLDFHLSILPLKSSVTLPSFF